MNGATILRMDHIRKEFPGVVALNDVSFDQRAGEVHALVGENGAGKSTLMKILGGAYRPDQGRIEIDGEDAHIHTPADALRLGISVIYQEFNLVPSLSVSDNIFLGKELSRSPLGRIDRARMRERSREALERLGLDHLDAALPVSRLSVAQQQLVEIAKALFNEARILVMDEPTSVLSQKESEALFRRIEELKARHISIIYISHRLEEVIALSDRITVLRDGEVVQSFDNAARDVSKEEIIRRMVGRNLADYFPARTPNIDPQPVLEVHNLRHAVHFDDVSFTVHRGEILGFYGLVGAGRTEIMKAVFGDLPIAGGEIVLEGRRVEIRSVRDAVARGIALIPEDRKREGLVTVMSLGDNISLPNLGRLNRFGHILQRARARLVERFLGELQIRPALPNRPARNFSGGNQQKAVIAKWLAGNPKVLIFDEPTRGIDVGAKTEVYALIDRLAASGAAVIIVSSEIMEVLGMCDTIVVIHDGTVSGRFSRAEATQEQLMRAAAGL